MFHLIMLPKLDALITQLPTLQLKRFLRDLRSGKVKKICVFVVEDERKQYRSTMVFSERNGP